MAETVPGRGDTDGGGPTSGPPTGPLFPEGVEAMARDLLAQGTPVPDQITQRIAPEADTEKTQPVGAAGTMPTPASAPAPSRPKVPKRLGPYELLDELGHGGMGVVYRARHAQLGTLHALKVLIAGEHASEELIARFRREASAVARMGTHPNIVAVHDLSEEGGLTWFSMDLVEGRSLRRALKERTFTPQETAATVEKVSRALHFAHTRGLVHRDVKPENIVVRADGEPLVMDFGLAREEGSKDHLTLTGQIMGTLAYMAPEQARGDVAAIDARTDVYALGGVLYDMLTGMPPHPGNQVAQVLPVILRGDILPPHRIRPDVPRELETIAMKALSLDPSRRYATAEALADDLGRFRRGEPIVARPPGPARRAWMFVNRHRAASLATASMLAVLLTIGTAWYFTPGKLKLDVTPKGASIRIDGDLVEGTEFTLRAGTHVVEVSAEHHEPDTRRVPVERRGTESLKIDLRHHKGTLVVEGNVADMTVEVAGKTFGARGRDSDFPTGRHHCVAWAPGHFQREIDIDVRQGDTTSALLWLDRGVVWARDLPGASGMAMLLRNGQGLTQVLQPELTRIAAWSIVDGEEAWSLSEGIGPDTAVLSLDLGTRLGQCAVIVGANSGTLRCVGAATKGQDPVVWTRKWPVKEGQGSIYPTVAAIRDMNEDGAADVAIACPNGDLVFVDGSNGREVRRMAMNLEHPCVRAQIAWQSWIILEGETPGTGTPAMVALRPEDGSIAWRRELPAGTAPMGLTPGEDVLVGSTSTWTYLDGRTGEPRWQIHSPCEWRPDADSLGVVSGDVAAPDASPEIVVRIAGRLTGIDSANGDVLWRRDGIIGAYAIGRSVVAAFTQEAFLGLDPRHGTTLWTLPGSAWGYHRSFVVEGRALAIVGIEGRGLVCVDADGRPVWTLRMESNVHATGMVGDLDGRGTAALLLSSPRTMVGVARLPSLLWERQAAEPLLATPLVEESGGQRRVVQKGAWPGRVCLAAFDGTTGSEVWRRVGDSAPNRAPGVIDWDEDGKADVVQHLTPWEKNDGALEVLRCCDGALLARWPLDPPWGNVYATPVGADLNGDRRADVAFQEWDTKLVRAVDGATGRELWRYGTGQPNMGGLGAADLDGDGLADLVAPSIDGYVHAIRGKDGKAIWKAQVGPSRSPPTLADLNGDGVPDVLVGTCEGRLWVLDGNTGDTIWNDAKGAEAFGRPAVCTIERLGKVIIAPFGPAGVAAFTWPGKGLLWQGPKGKGVTASPVVADIDADGRPEVVLGTMDGEMLVLDAARGTPLWSWKLADAIIEADPAVADLDGDGLLDIVIASQSRALTAIRGRRSHRK